MFGERASPAMKKVDFNIGTAAVAGSRTDLGAASRVMEQHRELLQVPGVVGMWVGAAASEPYIMLAVKEGRSASLTRTIPDSLDGINIYYTEGFFRR